MQILVQFSPIKHFAMNQRMWDTLRMTIMQEQEVLKAIAFIYLACSHLVDTNLTDEEKQVLVTRLHHWIPIGDEELAMTALEDAIAIYQQRATIPDRLTELHTMADILKGNLDPSQLSDVVYDLIRIARADGNVSAAETNFIIATARTFGLEDES